MASIQHLVNAHPITTAQSIAQRGKTFRLPANTVGLKVMAKFTSGSGGTTAKAYIQTSFDNETTWIDIMSFAFTTSDATNVLGVREETAIVSAVTASTGSLTGGTAVSGIIGQHVRAMIVTTGTYTGASMDLWMRVEQGED